jgi:hypothetical protein
MIYMILKLTLEIDPENETVFRKFRDKYFPFSEQKHN